MGKGAPAPQLADRLLAVLNLCQQLNSQREIDSLLDLIAREAARLLEAERASIFLLDREAMELWTQVALGSEPIRFDARRGIAGAAALGEEFIRVDDAAADPRFYGGIDEAVGYRTRNLLAAPLRTHSGEVIGAFEVLNRRHGDFTADDEELLKALTAQAGVAIETAQLMGELERHRDELRQENEQLWSEIGRSFAPRNILGNSSRIQEILRTIERVRGAWVDVLVTGESGTGKELIARALHYSGPYARRPFVALNCAALPEQLVESELFGIERGVATGVEQRTGKFEQANGGTLFLDEIGDLSPAAQTKILRALQDRTIERVGGRKPIEIQVRVVAATNKDLEAEVKKKRFRSDLYYRLNVIRIHTAPLREIREDIPLLARHHLSRHCRELGKQAKTLSPEALERLSGYGWPGNVRQLDNEMKRLAVLAPQRVVQEEDLSDAIRSAPATPPEASAANLRQTVEALERRLIRDALKANRGNQQRTAIDLGLSRQGLIQKMKRYELYSPRRRPSRR